MNNYHRGASVQTVSREDYRRLDNRVTCILQQRWPANEISQWVGMLQGEQQAIACAILRRRHPRPTSLTLPAISPEVPNPYQVRVNRPTVPVRSADGRPVGRRHIVDGLTTAGGRLPAGVIEYVQPLPNHLGNIEIGEISYLPLPFIHNPNNIISIEERMLVWFLLC